MERLKSATPLGSGYNITGVSPARIKPSENKTLLHCPQLIDLKRLYLFDSFLGRKKPIIIAKLDRVGKHPCITYLTQEKWGYVESLLYTIP